MWSRVRDSHTEPPARFGKDLADVRRSLAEEIPRVDPPVDAVEDATTVGVDQAAKKHLRFVVDDPLLPRGENDAAFVLPAGPVLREEARPPLRVRRYVHCLRPVRPLSDRHAVS